MVVRKNQRNNTQKVLHIKDQSCKKLHFALIITKENQCFTKKTYIRRKYCFEGLF